MMKTKINITRYVIMLLAFLIPVWEKLVPVVIAVLCLLWLLEGDFKNKFQNIFRDKISLIFILFYVLYVAGLIYTTDMGRGWFDLEVKLSLLVFPLLFLSGSKNISETKRSDVLKSFVAGSLAITVFLFVRALYLSFQTNEFARLTYSYLSFHTSPSYLAMYLNFSVMVVFFSFFDKVKSKFILFLQFLLIVFFAGFIVLLSSKSGILTLALSLVFMFIYLLVRKKYLVVSILALVSLVAFFLVVKYAKYTTKRMITAVNIFMNYKSVQSDAEESTSERILVWKASSQIIKNNPLLGVGTGDVKEELLREYKDDNILYAIENSLNSHNQYLQTGVAIGSVGLLVLLLTLFIPMVGAIGQRNWIYLIFLLLIGINLLFESMLERQAGVVFYAFINALLYSRMKKRTI